MAITGADRLFWLELRSEGLLPQSPAVLELGQANWYGDCLPSVLADDVQKYASEGSIGVLLDRLKEPGSKIEPLPFIQAEVFYYAVLGAAYIESVDFNGTPRSLPMDLNEPTHFTGKDIVINSGTAEHIFNQRQFFQTCHDACRFGGLMVHDLPAWGWLDHGFYNYHPTFVVDLAAANGYEILKWWLYDLKGPRIQRVKTPKDVHAYAEQYGPAGSVMHAVCYRKKQDIPFQMPFQGFYAGTLEPELTEAWHTER